MKDPGKTNQGAVSNNIQISEYKIDQAGKQKNHYESQLRKTRKPQIA